MTIIEIARRASVSRSTVSRVINHDETVDRKLARRVQVIIDEAGFRPSRQARALAGGRTNTVGLIVSEISGGNPFFSEIILYFERAAAREGYEVLIGFADIETHPEQVASCASRMRDRQVEGIAVLTFGMERCLSSASIDIPLIYAGSNGDLPGVRNIRINYLAGIRQAVKHLVGCGHRRIGYLCGRLDWSSMRTRYGAVRRAIKGAGLSLDSELFVECSQTFGGGARGILDLLNLPKPPTAVMCCNDVAAIGALKTLTTLGMQAGRDIALVGFDDLTICKFIHPSLSTIQFAPSEIARLALRALVEEIQNSKDKTDYVYETCFVLRESTCAPKR